MKVSSTVIALAAGLTLVAGSARAQGSPSEDQILKSLQLPGDLKDTTRGIRPVVPAQTPAATPTAATPTSATPAASAPRAAAAGAAPRPAIAPPVVAGAPSVSLSVQFATNSADLTPAATRTLDELGRALSSPSLAPFHFRIEGHTDTVGAAEANKLLSERRAAKVVDYLATKFNLDRSRLEPAGLGEDGLLVQTRQQVAEPRNRRVQVINLGA